MHRTGNSNATLLTASNLMKIRFLTAKIKRKLWAKIVRSTRTRFFYPALYLSWWHSVLHGKSDRLPQNCFMTAIPNADAGIGHQMANWIAGCWFAKQFNLTHVHSPFSSTKWEQLLGFGEKVIPTKSMLSENGYKCVSLQIFDEYDNTEVDRVRKIISSYKGCKVVFVLEQDQFYHDQFGVCSEIQSLFFGANARQNDRLLYTPDHFNVAIHVRRGDIVQGNHNRNTNLQMRWQDADYFYKLLSNVLASIDCQRRIKIYLFSQGSQDAFKHFENLGDIEYCLEMDAPSSFLHMIHADLLITSKSSFSYKPALISRGIKVCPQHFWHGYPNKDDWFLAADDGSLSQRDRSRLSAILRQTDKIARQS